MKSGYKVSCQHDISHDSQPVPGCIGTTVVATARVRVKGTTCFLRYNSWLIGCSKTTISVLLWQVQQINFTEALDLTNTCYRAMCQAGVPAWVWHSTPSLCNQVSCISSGQQELGAVVTAENNLHSSLL